MNTDAIPAGTVTFLFTDIESSTRLWEMYPEAMKPSLARHDAILRRAIEANRGTIVKTTGDGCHAVFKSAADAILASLAAQQALNAENWSELQPQALRVRMGLHTGEAEARAGDFFGTEVNRAARLMSIGHGGQILISASTTELARDFLPGGTTLLDLGEHRLKDLNRPEHIYQLVHANLPVNFPPVKSLDVYPNNLPVQLTSFIGREREINETRQLISNSRLVTLTGSGGTGKTRLAQQVAAEVLSSFTDGVWLVELAPVLDTGMVLPTLASVLELSAMPNIPLLDLVTDYLRSKQMLIVLDNCEHLIDTCAELGDHLLRSCPRLKILATSREALSIAGEASYRVPSLSLPVLEDLTLDKISLSEAAQLFIERVTAANPRFQLTDSNTPAVAQICHRLDGIPLALELAAARIRLFSPEQIAARLNDRFRLLTGGSRTALPRQQTLRALIDWSYDLLSEPERALLRRLSVFVGGWAFEAAEAVCSDLDVLTLLENLVNKSLVVVEEIMGQARYHMLETIRQYAREKLIEAGEAAALRNRHLDYYLQLSEQAEPEIHGNQAFVWFDRLDLDIDNIRSAADWGQDERPEDVLLLIGNLFFYWTLRVEDRFQAIRFLNLLLAKVEALPAGPASRRRMRARARGRTTVALLLMGTGDNQASITAFTDAIALEREAGDRFYLAFALGVRASLALIVGNPATGRAEAEESEALLREEGENRWLLIALPSLAMIEQMLGNQARADQLRQEIRLYMKQIDHPMFIPTFLGLGFEARFRGQREEAQAYFTEGLRLAKRVKTKFFGTGLESELAHLARERGDLQAAKEAYCKLIWKWKDIGQHAAVAHLLECFAYIAQSEHEPERAARLFGAAEAIRERIHVPMREVERIEYEQNVAALRSEIDAAAITATWAEGHTMDIEHAIRFAVTLS